MTSRPWVTPSYCAECRRNHPGLCNCWCHSPAASARALRRARAALAALALAALAVTAIAGCGPAGSPNCPPGQWHVEKPGTGWECASGGGSVFTPPGGSAS